jgi:hypothetical protein
MPKKTACGPEHFPQGLKPIESRPFNVWAEAHTYRFLVVRGVFPQPLKPDLEAVFDVRDKSRTNPRSTASAAYELCVRCLTLAALITMA